MHNYTLGEAKSTPLTAVTKIILERAFKRETNNRTRLGNWLGNLFTSYHIHTHTINIHTIYMYTESSSVPSLTVQVNTNAKVQWLL